MSADNMIYIQQQDDGKWWVWMDFASNEVPSPDPHNSFDRKKAARDFAFEWYSREAIVEYGVIELKPSSGPASNIQELIGIVKGFYRSGHNYNDEDCLYSCPKHEDYCGEGEDEDCHCGLDEHNSKIDDALQIIDNLHPPVA